MVIVIQTEPAPANPKTEYSFTAFFTSNTINFTLVALKKCSKGENWLFKLDTQVYCFYSLFESSLSPVYTFVYHTDSSPEIWARG